MKTKRLFIATCLSIGLNSLSIGQTKLPPIGSENGTRLPGKFVWADLVTDKVPQARAFYRALFGWTFRDYGKYVIVSNGDRPIAGMFARPRPAESAAKPRWFGYISVPNVESVQQMVTEAGGRVLAPSREFPGRGQQAVFTDPEGALFGVINSSSGDPEDYQPAMGDWIWIQMWSRDARKATEFYRAVAGYEISENTASARSNDYVLMSGNYTRGTVLTLPPEFKDIRPTWLLYVRVKNVAETVAKVPSLGGKVLVAPSHELFQNHVAIAADPTGAAIGLLEWDEKVQ